MIESAGWRVLHSRIGIIIKSRKMKKKEIHYIWVHWDSSTGSTHSYLVSNKAMPFELAKKQIKSMSPEVLYRSCPDWLKDCVRITISAQNIINRDVRYKRIINIKKK